MATLSGYAKYVEANGCGYTLMFSGAVTTAKVLMQIVADAAMPLEVVEVAVDGQSDSADAMEIIIARYSTKSTSGTSASGLLGEWSPDNPTSTVDVGTGDTGTLFTTPGTQTDILVRRDASVQAGGGFFWSKNMSGGPPLFVPAAGILGIQSNITIT